MERGITLLLQSRWKSALLQGVGMRRNVKDKTFPDTKLWRIRVKNPCGASGLKVPVTCLKQKVPLSIVERGFRGEV
jgi:hypothetical protein